MSTNLIVGSVLEATKDDVVLGDFVVKKGTKIKIVHDDPCVQISLKISENIQVLMIFINKSYLNENFKKSTEEF
jgi:hypothetical protein